MEMQWSRIKSFHFSYRAEYVKIVTKPVLAVHGFEMSSELDVISKCSSSSQPLRYHDIYVPYIRSPSYHIALYLPYPPTSLSNASYYP